MNPVAGSPPTLEWIAVDRLMVDEAYQRATDGSKSRALIFRITRDWNWSFCQPLVVSRRADGSLFVIDGQHRLAAALGRGDIPHLPCVVLSGQESAQEAQSFVALNTHRQTLSQADIFNAMLAAGDEHAIATAAVLTETGWRCARSCVVAKSTPGQIGCAPMIVKALKLEGDAIVRNALTALREAYPDTAIQNASTLLRALFLVFRREEAKDDPDVFIQSLGEVEPSGWEDEGQDVRRANPALSRIESVAAAMVNAYRETLDEQRLAA